MVFKFVNVKYLKGNKYVFVKFLFVNNYMNFKELKVRLIDIKVLKLLNEILWFINFFIFIKVLKYFCRENKLYKLFNY